MSKKCSKCDKTVYPTEELKCLDKSWHKLCFKCEVCNTQLNLNNFKGYKKLPYCNAHVPIVTATAVSQTLEQSRLKNITQLNSKVAYQKDYQDNVIGKVTSVAEDPTTQRVKNLGNILGNKYATNDNSSAPSHAQGYGYQDDDQPPLPPANSNIQESSTYKALYDYEAADQDEVSIEEGDIVVNCRVVTDGWVQGTVERSGQTGMIPENYLEMC